MKPRARGAVLPVAWTRDVGEWVTALSVAGDLVAVATAAGDVLVLRTADGEVRARFRAHEGGVLSLDAHPAAGVLATGGRDGHLRLWDPDGREIAGHRSGAPWVERVRWAPSGGTLAAAAGRELLLLDAGGAIRARSAPRPSTVSGLAWSRAPEQLWSSELRGVRRFSPETGEELGGVACPGSLVAIAVTPDATAVACAGQDTTVRHFRVADGHALTLRAGGTKAAPLAFSASGRYLAHNGSAEVVVWDFQGPASDPGQPTPRLLRTHQARVTAVEPSPVAERLASGAADGSVAVWDLASAGRRLGFAMLDGGASQLAWSPSGEGVFAGTATGVVTRFVAGTDELTV